MTVQRTRRLFFVFFFTGVIFFSAAQEGGGSDEIPVEPDWSGPLPTLYSKGDQTFSITLGVLFPTVFFDGNGSYTHNIDPVGGMGALTYDYFLSPHIFVGGQISGMFVGTLARNMLYIIPMGVRVGYQFILGRFEFPLSLMLGMAPMKFLDSGYFGYLFLKPGASVFWRFNSEWSFGLNTAWWWVPQWPRDISKSAYGNFLELTLSATYHF
jgi:hypothetical protein